MFNTASDYAINKKNPNAIVYVDVKGNTTILTKKDFATEEDFCYWKKLSDEDYHLLDIHEHKIAKRSVSLYALAPEYVVVDSQEVFHLNQIDKQEHEKFLCLLEKGLNECITPKQKTRIWKHYAEQKTLLEIAEEECIAVQSVFDSIQGAQKKLLKFFRKTT